jgi:hypothetical protein
MSVIGLLLFIVIVSGSNLYYRHKRERAIRELLKARKGTQDAIKTLHETIQSR